MIRSCKLPLLFLACLCLFSGCRMRQGHQKDVMPAEADTLVVNEEPVIVEPVFEMSLIPAETEARMRGVSYPEGAEIQLSELRYLKLSYIDFDGVEQVGEMICNQAIAQDLLDIFRALYEARYPIRSIRLIDEFGGDDVASMEADNTSCFNYRVVAGTKTLSKHAKGLAVDVNPLENPYVRSSEVSPPAGAPYADRSKEFPHKIDTDDLCYRLFMEHGFTWGGSWRTVKDYQHFQK